MPSTKMTFESGAASINTSRSKFDLSHRNTMTMRAGYLYPIFAYSDVLPGDTHFLGTSFVIRSSTPITAVMDDAYIQIEYWYVPNKLVLSRASMSPSLDDSIHSWKFFMGAQDNLLNITPSDNNNLLPKLSFSGIGFTAAQVKSVYLESLAHYLDYPYIDGDQGEIGFNPFAMLAFYKVWSDAYREPNLMNPVTFSIDSSNTINFTLNAAAGIVSSNIYSNTLPVICREHGYFGSALPWPQRNQTGVTLNLSGFAPLDTNSISSRFTGGFPILSSQSNLSGGSRYGLVLSGSGGAYGTLGTNGTQASQSSSIGNIVGSNLGVSLEAAGLTINNLRYSFALQAYYENLARMGNRYQDIIRRYGVVVSEVADDRAEYLGGKRLPLTNSQVIGNNALSTPNSTASGNGIGATGGFLNSSDSDHYFGKSFKDFGTIIGVAFIRTHDTFGNRLSKERSRMSPFDYYMPEFSGIGEVTIKKSELWISDGTSISGFDATDLSDFGFQEYGASYRYHEDSAHGLVSPDYGDLKYWTYANDFATQISQSSAAKIYDSLDLGWFLNGAPIEFNIDQTLKVSGATSGYQFLVQFYFDWQAVRPIKQHSIPAVLGQR